MESLANRLSIYGMVFIAGIIAALYLNNVQQLWSEHGQLKVIQARVIPKLKDAAGCQTARARIATILAERSEKGADINLNTIPDCPLPPKAPILNVLKK